MKRHTIMVAAILVVFQYPVSAQIKEPAKTVEAKILKARPLPLHNVRLLGGPLKVSQDLNARYLLELEPDRMLSYLRRRAGLQSTAEPYGGWDGEGRQLTGHIAGHYLSGVSFMWAATGDVRFKDRADYLVNRLKEIQDKHGDGYIGALMDREGVSGKVRFEELAKGVIRSGGFDLNGLWSPWYVQHKIYAGLRDAYRYTGNRTSLDVEIQFAEWAERILADLDDNQIQRMLGTEFGGMNEVASDLYADTGDKRWLALADKFYHHAIVDELAAGRDILAHKHGNTLVPKLQGSLALYIYSGDEIHGKAARFFWDQVALHHSFATGGHGKNEYFGDPDNLNDMIDGRTAESCNVYNMIKMARSLFSVEPDIRYADFHERALFNHILASQNPEDGRVCYMVPVGRGVQHEYQNMFQSFTCCVGSSMESHALHGYGIYYESGDKLWVNLYAPSTADWQSAGVKFELATSFSEGESATLKVNPRTSKKFTIALRRPYWAGAGFSVKVNGEAVNNLPRAGSYVELSRTWRSGDTVELVLPKALRVEALTDNPRRVALMYGPLTLAGDLGPEVPRGRKGGAGPAPEPAAVPVFMTAEQPVEKWLKPVAGKTGVFQAQAIGQGREVEFTPFYQLPRRRYAIYWDLFTPQEWEKQSRDYIAEQERQKSVEAATVAFAQPGQMQTERDFNMQGENSSPVQLQGRFGRRGTGWFSFDLPVEPASPMLLIVTYSNDGPRRSFDVLVDGRKVGEYSSERRSPEQDVRFFDVEYALPADMVKDKEKVTVRFAATNGDQIAGVFGLRMVRADRAR